MGAAGLSHRLEAFKDRQSILSHLIPHCSQGEGEGEHSSPATNSHHQGAKLWEHSPHTNTLIPTPALIHPLSPDSPLLFCHSLVYPGFPQPPPPGVRGVSSPCTSALWVCFEKSKSSGTPDFCTQKYSLLSQNCLFLFWLACGTVSCWLNLFLTPNLNLP